MNELVVLSVAGAGTSAMRASAIVLAGGRTLPEAATRALVYAKHVVLAALVASVVAGHEGVVVPCLPSPQLLGAIVVTV
ncbi:MAG: AzlD domain-containing protein, partial [Chloroflexi bacterium]|nr:AzlD domain-containing protein [Chloroflexota bacterium]